MSGTEATVEVHSDITLDAKSLGSLSLEFLDGKPVEAASPIEPISPPYNPSHREPPLGSPTKPTPAEEEAKPRELETPHGATNGWKMRCAKSLPRCKATAVVTALLRKGADPKATTEVIGGASLSVTGGHTSGFGLRLSRAGLALLRSHRRLVCTLKSPRRLRR